MAKKPTKPAQKKIRENAVEVDPRFGKFAEAYVESGNALRSAKDAGYPDDYARAHAHKLVARLRLKVGPVMSAHGLDIVYIAKRLKTLSRAKTVKWNPQKTVIPTEILDGKVISPRKVIGGWDTFQDGGIQLGAINTAIKLAGLEPAVQVKLKGSNGGGLLMVHHSIPRPRGKEPKVLPPE